MTESDRRLHPLSVPFAVGSQLRGFIIPAVLFIFFSKGMGWQIWALWLSIPITLVGVLRYVTFRYRFDADELVIHTGLFFRNERRLRYERIQNVEVVRNPAHRLLRVAEIRLQTGGGKEPEARLSVVGEHAVEEIRELVFDARRRLAGTPAPVPDASGEGADAAPVAVAAGRTLVRLGTRDLIIFGLIENRGMLVIGALFGLMWEANVFDAPRVPDAGLIESMTHAIRTANSLVEMVGRLAGLIAVGLAALFFVVRVLSILWAIVRLHHFTLTRDGNELRSTCGLLTTLRSTIPAHRIQLVTVNESPLHRLFRRVSVRVQTAGGDEQASVTREWLAPILRREDADALIRDVLPGASLDALTWSPVHPDARARILREILRVGGTIALAVVWLGWWVSVLVLLVFALPAWRVARGQARGLGYHLSDEYVVFRSGWLWRHVSIAPYSKVQAVRMADSFFDRRWGMAGVAADTAGGGTNRINVPYLSTADARALYRHLTRRAAETAFRW